MSRSHALGRALRASALTLTLALGACATANTAPPADFAQTASAAPEIATGTRVLVERNGQWLPATVIGRYDAERVMVQYEGASPAWVEPVSADRVRLLPGSGPSDFRVGEKVLVSVQGRRMLAEIIQQIGVDEWRVHYDGYAAEVAPNVKLGLLQRPFPNPTAHPPGELIDVDVGGRLLGAKVLVALAADRWLVRFDGFGPEYDQEVTADRVRLRAPLVAASTSDAPAAPGPPPATAPPVATAPASASAFGPNEEVLVAHRGVYHLAFVVGPGANGKLRVRYKSSAVGNEARVGDSDEEIAKDRLSRFVSLPKGARLAANQNVFVEYRGLYFPGRIAKIVDKGQVRIRYDGFGPEADEIVPTKRVRPRP